MKVFITRDIPAVAYKLLKKNNIEFRVFNKDYAIPRTALIKNIRRVDGLISLLTEKIDKEVIDSMPACKIIANYASVIIILM